MAIQKRDVFASDLFGEAKKGAKDLNDELDETLKLLEKTSASHVISPDKSQQDDKALKGVLMTLEAIEKKLREIMKLNGKEAAKVKPVRDNKRDINNANRAIQAERRHQQVTQALTTTQREQQRVQQQLSREAARTTTVRSREFRELQRLREENRRYVQGIRQEIREQGVNRNSIQGLINQTRQLITARDSLDRSTREGRREFARLNREIVRNRDELQRYSSSVGSMSGVLGRLSSGFTGLQRAVGLFGAALSAGTVIKGAVDEFKEFESTLTNVLTLLSEGQREEFGAELKEGSLDLMKKYGFSIQDVNKALFDTVSAGVPASEAINFLDTAGAKLAKGGAADLGVAVDAITAGLNSFHLEIDQAEVVANAFFATQKGGKTTVEELAASFAQASPTANALGLNIGELAGQIQVLTLNSVPTAQAFTQVSAIMNQLNSASDSQRAAFDKVGIATGAAGVKAQGFANIMEILNKEAQKNPDILAELFTSSEALKGAQLLLGESYSDLTEAVRTINEDIGENSSLSLAAAVVAETHADKSKRLTGEFTAMSIALGEKLLPILNTIKQGFLDFTKFLIKNSATLKFLGKILLVAAAGFVTFKIATRLARIELAKTKIGLFITSLRTMRKTMILTSGAMKKGAFSARTFGTALKTIPLLGILSALVSVVTAMAFFSSATDDAAAAQERFNEGLATGKANAEEAVAEQKKLTAERLKGLKQEGEERKALGDDAAAIDQDIRDFEIEQLKTSNDSNARIIEQKHKNVIEQAEKAKVETIRIAKELVAAEAELYEGREKFLLIEDLKEQGAEVQGAFNDLEGQYTADAKVREQIMVENNARIKELISESNVARTKLGKGLTDAQKKEIERRNKLLLDLERQIRNVRISLIEDDQKREIRKIEAQTADLIAAAKAKAGNDRRLKAQFDLLEIELERRKLQNIQKIKDKFAEKEEKERKKTRDIITSQIEDESVRSIVELQDKHKDEFDELDKSLKKQLITLEEFERRKAAIKTRQTSETEQLESEIATRGFDRKAAEEDAKSEEEFVRQNFENLQDFELKKQAFEDAMLQRELERERLRLQMLKDAHADKVTIAEQEAKLRELELKQIERDLNTESEIAAKQQEAREANIAAAEEFFDLTAERLTERLQQQIDALDVVLKQSEKVQSRLEAMAQNDTVTQSIAAEEKKQAEILQEKEKRAKRQQQIEVGLALIKIFTAELARAEADGGGTGANTGNALAKTAVTSAGLFALLSNLPAFFHGTEDTGTQGFATDKHGKITGYTHERERVFTANQNKIIPKGMNNDAAARVLQAYGAQGMTVGHDMPVHDGLLREAAVANTVIVHVQTDPRLLNEMKSIGAGMRANTKAIKNIPRERLETHIDAFEQIAQHTIETNNKKLITNYKLKEIPDLIRWNRGKGFR